MSTQSAFAFGFPSSFCRACHRGLKNPESVRRGIGPVCGRKGGKDAMEKDEYKITTQEELERMKPLPGIESFVFMRGNDGTAQFNFAQNIRIHSPTGMEYGYGGSGPADCALNILLHFVDGRTAWGLHQSFKWDFIAPIDRDAKYELHAGRILEWLRERRVKV